MKKTTTLMTVEELLHTTLVNKALDNGDTETLKTLMSKDYTLTKDKEVVDSNEQC